MRYLPDKEKRSRLASLARERGECPQRSDSRRVLPPNAEGEKRISGAFAIVRSMLPIRQCFLPICEVRRGKSLVETRSWEATPEIALPRHDERHHPTWTSIRRQLARSAYIPLEMAGVVGGGWIDWEVEREFVMVEKVPVHTNRVGGVSSQPKLGVRVCVPWWSVHAKMP